MADAKSTGQFVAHHPTEVESIVGDYAEPNPTLHANLALVLETVEPMPPLHYADATLASGPPLRLMRAPFQLMRGN